MKPNSKTEQYRSLYEQFQSSGLSLGKFAEQAGKSKSTLSEQFKRIEQHSEQSAEHFDPFGMGEAEQVPEQSEPNTEQVDPFGVEETEHQEPNTEHPEAEHPEQSAEQSFGMADGETEQSAEQSGEAERSSEQSSFGDQSGIERFSEQSEQEGEAEQIGEVEHKESEHVENPEPEREGEAEQGEADPDESGQLEAVREADLEESGRGTSSALADRLAELEQENELLRAGLPEGVTLEDLQHWSMVEAFCAKNSVSPMDILDRWLVWKSANDVLEHELKKERELSRYREDRLVWLNSINNQLLGLPADATSADITAAARRMRINVAEYAGAPCPGEPADAAIRRARSEINGESPAPASEGPRIKDWSLTNEVLAGEPVKPAVESLAYGSARFDLDDDVPDGWQAVKKPTPKTPTPARLRKADPAESGGGWLDKLGNAIEGLFR